MWQGWADQGSTVEATLNYYAAVRKYMGAKRAADFMNLYMIPGVSHCADVADFLTPLISWVEDGRAPGRVVATYPSSSRTRAVFPYPTTSVYMGHGDVNDAANYVAGPPTPGVSDVDSPCRATVRRPAVTAAQRMAVQPEKIVLTSSAWA
jgi:feruloyl esterase